VKILYVLRTDESQIPTLQQRDDGHVRRGGLQFLQQQIRWDINKYKT